MWIEGLGEMSFLACEPFLTVSARADQCTIAEVGREKTFQANPFHVLREQISRFRIEPPGDTRIFPCGAIGYFGYGLRHFLERLPQQACDDIPSGSLPDLFFAFYDSMLAVDVCGGLARLIQVDFGRARGAHAESGGAEALTALVKDVGGRDSRGSAIVPQLQRECHGPAVHANFIREEYEAAVRRAIEYIFAGDIFQVNLSQRFAFQRPATCETSGSANSGLDAGTTTELAELFLRLRGISPAPFSCLLGIGQGRGVVSTSPERFLRIRGRHCETRPIKGTRKRGATEREDEAMRRELLNSEKDSAELAMIIDLERNDLGKVCKYGSVRVREAKRLESYATVHHLVGIVDGEMHDCYDSIDVIKAMFPCGSITGAPKIRAMEIIDELEPSQRGVYTGSIGYIGFDGSVDLSVAIRIVQVTPTTAFYHVGGGIVADSEPAAEYEETIAKGAALGRALAVQH
jgi:para-aminobenzoate synthetase component 1